MNQSPSVESQRIDRSTVAPRFLPTILRPGTAGDAEICGQICFDAFSGISGRYGFPRDFPDVEAAVGLFRFALEQPQVETVVAVRDGKVVGSNVGWNRPPVAGVGPITVDPALQDAGVGRLLMQHVIDAAEAAGCSSVRLVQAAYHGRSMALYTRLGFDAVEPLSCLQGRSTLTSIPGRSVRAARASDRTACLALAEALHGFSRAAEFDAAVQAGTARVVETDGVIAGYGTDIGFFGHAVARSNEELKALIAAASGFPGPGVLIPTRNAELLRWCLENGLRIVQPMTLMSRGHYREPAGAWLPSVIF